MNTDECLICEKPRGVSHQPPGGYIYREKYFSICHTPLAYGPLGTLFIESNRHFLDYAQMSVQETVADGKLLARIYHHLRSVTLAERIYQVTLLEGIPDFHSWLIPRRKSDPERGMKFLSLDLTCELDEVHLLVNDLKALLAEPTDEI